MKVHASFCRPQSSLLCYIFPLETIVWGLPIWLRISLPSNLRKVWWNDVEPSPIMLCHWRGVGYRQASNIPDVACCRLDFFLYTDTARRFIYQNVQYFVRSMADVLNFTILKIFFAEMQWNSTVLTMAIHHSCIMATYWHLCCHVSELIEADNLPPSSSNRLISRSGELKFPSLPLDNIWAMMIVWRIRVKIIRTVLCCIV